LGNGGTRCKGVKELLDQKVLAMGSRKGGSEDAGGVDGCSDEGGKRVGEKSAGRQKLTATSLMRLGG